MRVINNFRDLCAEVEDCGLHDQSLYHSDWVELVSRKYLDLLESKYGFKYGMETPKLESDDEFWDIFEEFELDDSEGSIYEFNQTQNLVSEISGYCGLGESGARHDSYFEKSSEKDAALEILKEYLDYVDGFDEKCDIESAYHFLKSLEKCEFKNSNEIFNAFKELKDLD